MAAADATPGTWAKLLQLLRPACSAAPTTNAASPNRVPSPGIERRQSPTAAEALAQYAALVRRIRIAYACPDEEFRRDLLAPMTALAAWLHTLPGPPGEGFERRGGALKQALTHCLYSLQAADGRTFSARLPEASCSGDQQTWRLACALGGLFYPLHNTLARIEVVTDDGSVWPRFASPLLDWLVSRGTITYRLRWHATREDCAGLATYAASRCIPPETMSRLSAGDTRGAAELINCISGLRDPKAQVAHVVAKVAAAIAARERPAEVASRDHLADALKRLFASSDWLPNAPGGHVWYGSDGMYLLWPEAADKILEVVPARRQATPPLSHEALLRDLAGLGVFDGSPSPLRRIRATGLPGPRLAVRLAPNSPLLQYLRREAMPLAQELGSPQAAAATADDESAPKPLSPPAHDAPATAISAAQRADQAAFDFQGRSLPLKAELDPVESTSSLTLDTSKISNPRTRETIDRVVARLDQSFDSMLAKTVPGGVFVAVAEFVGQSGNGACVVRALHEAQLLRCEVEGSDRRVVSQKMEGAEMIGVVLRESAFGGYREWKGRWHADGGLHAPETSEASRREHPA